MNDLMELQKLWTRRGIEDTLANTQGSFATSLLERLKAFESFQSRINRIKIAVIAAILTLLVYSVVASGTYSIPLYIGMAVIIVASSFFLIYYIKNQFNVAKLDFTSPSNVFLANAIDMLHRQNAIFKWPFVLFVGAIVVGFNLVNIGAASNSGIWERVTLHVTMSLFITFSAYVGWVIRKWRIKKEVYPLLDELNRIQEVLCTCG